MRVTVSLHDFQEVLEGKPNNSQTYTQTFTQYILHLHLQNEVPLAKCSDTLMDLPPTDGLFTRTVWVKHPLEGMAAVPPKF